MLEWSCVYKKETCMYFRAQGFKPSPSLKLLEQYEFLLNTDPKKMVFLYLHLS